MYWLLMNEGDIWSVEEPDSRILYVDFHNCRLFTSVMSISFY